MALTNKQQVFIEEYLQVWNASEAARRAGYSEKTAYSIGQENLTKPAIADEISRRVSQIQADVHSGIVSRALDGKRVFVPEPKVKTQSYSLYLIRAANGLTKIGIACDVGKRFSGLNTASPVELELLWSAPMLFARETEMELHQRYQDKRIKGEWFNLSDADVAEIIRRYGPHK